MLDVHAKLTVAWPASRPCFWAGRWAIDRRPASASARSSASCASTTARPPAGRFTSEPGHNLAGEAIVWIDYGNALAIHRLRPGPSRDFRERRLASPSALERRVSAGCVVVPVAFHDEVVAPVLGRSRAVVYVMGKDGSARAL